MVNFNELRKVLNKGGMSIRLGKDKTAVLDSVNFRGIKDSAYQEALSLVANSTKEDTFSFAKKLSVKKLNTLKDVNNRAQRNLDSFITSFYSGGKGVRTSIRDSIFNERFNLGNEVDPTTYATAFPNIYISPYEASSLYSQKGVFETIINKKAKSILLNGFEVVNPHFSQRQLDKINEKVDTLNVKKVVSDAVRDSLVYGGSLIFPMFKNDTPATTSLKLSALLKLGVVKESCIDYFVTLDRWQTFIIPPFNPTQRSFQYPDYYTIPFLGSDVHSTRTSRVVTASQAGYWGQVINQGWGISDMLSYLQSGMNYKVAVQSLPLMIKQMSILARVINVDGVLATEGSNALDALIEQDTIRMREISPNNPVALDVLGELKSIDRNFSQVPELIRLLRQDLASDATIPEPMLFSSEKGNFSSGDDTQGNQSKMWESVKMIHKEVETQIKQLAKILVIDALGTDNNIVKELPYTRIVFEEPVIANALERSQIRKNVSESVFNLVSAQVPMQDAVELATSNPSKDLSVSADLLERLEAKQKEIDENDKKRKVLELEQMKATVEQTKQSAQNASLSQTGARPKNALTEEDKNKGKSPAEKNREKAKADKEEKGYSRLEQKEHTKTRVGSEKRHEKLAKSENRKLV